MLFNNFSGEADVPAWPIFCCAHPEHRHIRAACRCRRHPYAEIRTTPSAPISAIDLLRAKLFVIFRACHFGPALGSLGADHMFRKKAPFPHERADDGGSQGWTIPHLVEVPCDLVRQLNRSPRTAKRAGGLASAGGLAEEAASVAGLSSNGFPALAAISSFSIAPETMEKSPFRPRAVHPTVNEIVGWVSSRARNGLLLPD